MSTLEGNLFFADKTYSFETIRMLSQVYVRSSDVAYWSKRRSPDGAERHPGSVIQVRSAV